MKTISVTTKKITIIVGIIMAILILLVFNTSAATEDPENDLRYKSKVEKVQKAAKEFTSQCALDLEEFRNKRVFKFFDENENLLYQSEVNVNKAINDEKLVKYLHQSDLVVNSDHTSFYRFSK